MGRSYLPLGPPTTPSGFRWNATEPRIVDSISRSCPFWTLFGHSGQLPTIWWPIGPPLDTRNVSLAKAKPTFPG